MTRTVNTHVESVRIANIDVVSEKLEKIASEIADYEHGVHLGYVGIANKFSEVWSRCFDMKTSIGKVSILQEEMSILGDVLDNVSEESTRRGKQ